MIEYVKSITHSVAAIGLAILSHADKCAAIGALFVITCQCGVSYYNLRKARIGYKKACDE